jgi:hypothetical protein
MSEFDREERNAEAALVRSAAKERYVQLRTDLANWNPLPFEDYRCHQCDEAPLCQSAFDDYNTDGACLEEK